MNIKAKEILHKGLRRFWTSHGKDVSGITPGWAKTLELALTHLDTAISVHDILGGYGRLKNAKLLRGHADRYSMEINGNWRLTFTVDDTLTGEVSKIDIEDFHRAGGAH